MFQMYRNAALYKRPLNSSKVVTVGSQTRKHMTTNVGARYLQIDIKQVCEI